MKHRSHHKRRKELVNEAMGLLGSYAEIMAKLKLYKSKILAEQECGHESSLPGLVVDVKGSVRQMRIEMATYSRRLDEIHEELGSYVVVSDIP